MIRRRRKGSLNKIIWQGKILLRVITSIIGIYPMKTIKQCQCESEKEEIYMKQQNSERSTFTDMEVGIFPVYSSMFHLNLSGLLISPTIPSLKFLAFIAYCIAKFKLLAAL